MTSSLGCRQPKFSPRLASLTISLAFIMPNQPDDVLLSVSSPRGRSSSDYFACCCDLRAKLMKLTHSQLQSSLRNALATFGPNSTQYLMIKYMVDEHTAKLALERMSLSSTNEQQR